MHRYPITFEPPRRFARNRGGHVGVILLLLLLGWEDSASLSTSWRIVATVVSLFWLVGFGLGLGHAEGARGWYGW